MFGDNRALNDLGRIQNGVSRALAKVLQLVRRLDRAPAVSSPSGWRLRPYAGEADIPIWLALRAAAFAGSSIGVRPWTLADFEREILAKSWWRPEAIWFVEAVDRESALAIGTATLARRGRVGKDRAVIHWLAVLPEFRRRGVGRLLVAQLERLVWRGGERELALETHDAWTEAVAFYQALGYRPSTRDE